MTEDVAPEDYLSGESGEVTGLRLPPVRSAADLALRALASAAATGPRLDRLAVRTPSRSVLVLSAYRPDSRLADALPRLRSERHRMRFALGAAGPADERLRAETVADQLAGGKFENLNRVLREAGDAADWTLVVDDDVRLPERFLDRFVALCERFRLDVAQPAQSQRSHAAWRVTRRRPLSLVRETRFVEIGPVTAFAREPAAELLPFPELRYGWGLDLHWAALAERRGWRLGVADALPVRHEDAPAAAAYGHDAAKAEAARFLADREYLPSRRAQETLVVHRTAGRR